MSKEKYASKFIKNQKNIIIIFINIKYCINSIRLTKSTLF